MRMYESQLGMRFTIYSSFSNVLSERILDGGRSFRKAPKTVRAASPRTLTANPLPCGFAYHSVVVVRHTNLPKWTLVSISGFGSAAVSVSPGTVGAAARIWGSTL